MQNLTLNKFDQYIIRQFWIILSIAILGFLSIFIIVDLIENLDRFLDNKVPSEIVFKYATLLRNSSDLHNLAKVRLLAQSAPT